MSAIFIIIVFVIMLLVIFKLMGKPVNNDFKEVKSLIQYKYKSKPLMTKNEFEFFNRLVLALPEYYVCPQVSLGALLEGDTTDYKLKNSIRLTFAQKFADYVVFSKENTVIAIVELDDKTHVKEKDDKRDAMLNQAGYKTIRFESKNKPTIEEIKKLFIDN